MSFSMSSVDVFARDMVLSPAGLSFLSALEASNRVKSSENKALSEFDAQVFSRVPFFECFYTNVVMLLPRVVFLACTFVATLVVPDYTKYLERCKAGVLATIALIGISLLGLSDPLKARNFVMSGLGELTRTESSLLDDYHRGSWVVSEALGRFTANLVLV